MKPLISLILIFALLFAFPVFANNDPVKIYIDGTLLTFDVDPAVVNGRTLVPFRKIFEVYNFQVGWTESTKTVIAAKENVILVLQIENIRAFFNNKAYQMDVPPMLISARTMVPLRFISETIGLSVSWNEAENAVYINSPS